MARLRSCLNGHFTRTDGTSVHIEGDVYFLRRRHQDGGDANIGIKFVDETSFSLGESGRMVIDEMIYDPSNNSNSSSSFSVVKGVFSFVSGQVAKSGDDAMVIRRLLRVSASGARRLPVRLLRRVHRTRSRFS